MARNETRDDGDARPLRVYVTENTWNLPRIVARRNGYFEDAGLAVEFVERSFRDIESEDIYERKNKHLFDNDGVDVYSACVWGTIKRAWDSPRGRIVAHNARSGNLPYTVFARRDTGISGPADLAGVTVGIKNHSGSHYATIAALEEHLDEDRIDVAHVGRPITRLEALHDGEIDAATLMGPEIAMAELLGMERVLTFSHGGSIIVPRTTTDEAVAAFVDALNRAIDDVNERPDDYRGYFVELAERSLADAPEIRGLLDLEALRERLTVPHYDEKVRPVEEADVARKLRWMKRHGLIAEEADMRQLV